MEQKQREPAVKPRLAPAPLDTLGAGSVAGAASATRLGGVPSRSRTGAEAKAPRSFDLAQDKFPRGLCQGKESCHVN